MLIPKVEDCYFYSRENNLIIANLIDGTKKPLIRLKQNFIDVTILEGIKYDYMIRYMSMFPSLWEKIELENTQTQLSLF